MNTSDTINPDSSREASETLPLGQLPDTVAGWEQVEPEHDSTLVEYWRRGSTHIVGKYEQMAIRELRDGTLRLIQTTYDQFRHQLTSRTLAERSPDEFNRVWNQARDRMDEYPATEPFDSRPALPNEVGNWVLTSRKHEGDARTTRWELDFGVAELVVEETRVESYYSHTKRVHRVEYREPPALDHEIVSEIPRTSAYEIAINTLQTIPRPVSELQAELDDLQSIKGVGPAKSKGLMLLGIRSPEDLSNHVENDTPLNSHHSEAVDKLLTETIRTELRR